VIDVNVPAPLIVVPGGRFRQVADVSVNITGEVSTRRFVFANAPPGVSSTAMATALTTRFMPNTPSGG